jgi:hypothetical protein
MPELPLFAAACQLEKEDPVMFDLAPPAEELRTREPVLLSETPPEPPVLTAAAIRNAIESWVDLPLSGGVRC